MSSSLVRQTQLADKWAGAEGQTSGGNAFVCRWRTPVLGPPDIDGYHKVLKVIWAYAEVGAGDMPSSDDSEAMGVFEDRICEAFEHDGHAYLAAVLTFDGARQWVFYTADVPECGRRLANMPQEEERYPIELSAESDPTWSWLRENVLGPVDWQGAQP